ncbi:helix-turn-helix domain-containing protein [Streptomyces hirsutus]|uniref:helix-turn-helix domain-containing protein n=1 Tax=Streptomyces hirsutus TaxID=35620 RepID=UPI0036CD4CCE
MPLIAVGCARDEGVREIARRIGRDPSVVSREIRRNGSQRGYRAPTAQKRAAVRRRPQQRLLERNMVLRQVRAKRMSGSERREEAKLACSSDHRKGVCQFSGPVSHAVVAVSNIHD